MVSYFTHKTEGNTLYIIRKKSQLKTTPWWPVFVSLFIVISFAIFPEKPNVQIFIGCAIAFVPIALYLEYLLFKRHMLIKITKLPEPRTVAFNNKIVVNPRFLYNMAGQGGGRYGYGFYLQKYDGDAFMCVDYIVHKQDMYAMMDLIAAHLEIDIRFDD